MMCCKRSSGRSAIVSASIDARIPDAKCEEEEEFIDSAMNDRF